MPGKKQSPSAEIHTNKVFQTLLFFDSSEQKRLVKFLQSPYFNQSKALTRLCEIFISQIESGHKGFDRQNIWQKMFPNVKYDDVNFRKYCSDLLKLIEEFMANESFNKDEEKKKIEAIGYSVRRKIEPIYNGLLRQARNLISTASYFPVSSYYNLYAIERHHHAMMDFDVRLDLKSNIEEISQNLDFFYWIEKLKLFSASLSHKKTGNFSYQINFVDEIIEYLNHFPLENAPELAIHYYAYMALKEEDNLDYYYKLRELLDKYAKFMPQEKAIEFFDSALHYCIGKANKGHNAFLQEYFELFNIAIEKEVFLIKGELSTWRFNNAVGVALRIGKLDWAEIFIQQYESILPIDSRQNTYTFNLARVYRYQQKFDKVLSLLRNVEYEDIGYNLISKTMLVITYFELDEMDALDSFIESFRVFLNRHKNIPAQRRKSYLNLIKFVRRLTRLLPGDTSAVEKLRQELIREKATTVNHEWLLEKLAELE